MGFVCVICERGLSGVIFLVIMVFYKGQGEQGWLNNPCSGGLAMQPAVSSSGWGQLERSLPLKSFEYGRVHTGGNRLRSSR